MTRLPVPWRRLPRASLLVILAASSAQAGTTVYRDKVFFRGREDPEIAHIVADSIKEVKTRDGAIFNPKGIVRIEYSGAPQSFRDAEAHRETSRFEDAIARYQTTLRNLQPDDRTFWIEPTCRYYIAECHLQLGELKQAEEAFNDLLTKHPDTRYKPDAILGLGRVHFEAGKYDAAYRRFDDLEAFAQETNWPEWLYAACAWKARTLRLQKKFEDALGYVQKVLVADPRKYESVITQARTEQALIYVAQGQYDKAIDLLRKQLERISAAVAEEMSQPGSERRMQHMEAQCKNALGKCYLERYEKTQKKADLQEALLAFLWNVTLHPNLPERTEALRRAAECFETLGQKKRADELRDELAGKAPE